MFGVQLGLNFFASATWCPLDVEVDDNENPKRFARCVWGWNDNIKLLANTSKIELRYYSRDGSTAHVLPLLPFEPFEESVDFSFTVIRYHDTYDQCFFCNRIFPEGMLCCETYNRVPGIHAMYCDERCQRAGWNLHQRFHKELEHGSSTADD
mmetsp:Transcript_26297/g.61625  ORF Transcript_26297/g.61625 Transcript_26297/m.61625 type:complete len:152 (+) Transcript_26297:673-1128(+)